MLNTTSLKWKATSALHLLVVYAHLRIFTESSILLQQAHKKGKKTALSACFDTYPGYDGDIDISNGNKVAVVFDDDDEDFKFRFNLRGLEADCTNCGIHIHSGLTCDNATLVGGHYWNPDKVEDPWTVAGGSVYNSNSDGRAKGSFQLSAGIDAEANMGHAVVIHGQGGERIGCGVLSKSRKAAKSCKATKSASRKVWGYKCIVLTCKFENDA